MAKKSDFQDVLHQFCKEVGVPIALMVDPSGEQTSKAVRKFCNQMVQPYGLSKRARNELTGLNFVSDYLKKQSENTLGRQTDRWYCVIIVPRWER